MMRMLRFIGCGLALAGLVWAMIAGGCEGTDKRLASGDGEFHPASATIQGETIVLTAPRVSRPNAVRFLFGGFDKPNLVNAAGLPASPFTTEDP